MTSHKEQHDITKEKQLKIPEIYDKNLNFLIGSGASFGLFPTLQLSIKSDDDSKETIETLATQFERSQNKTKSALLFMHYYKECIEPVLKFDATTCAADPEKKAVIENYEKFLKTILSMLRRKKINDSKSCNLFTTNYDGCIAHVADEIIKSGTDEFILNDGARGFFRRHFSAKNYSSQVSQSGVFDRYSTQIPQINLLHIHGSTYWKKDGDNIQIDYTSPICKVLDSTLIPDIGNFSATLNNGSKRVSDIPNIDLTEEQIKKFWEAYKKLPIVNPTGWKFYETVFVEHYYQMLRHLSYELERPGTVLITFGFSFADEHILNLIKRSLGNPELQVFVSCFNHAEYESLSMKFNKFRNITFLKAANGDLDFSMFNSEVFTLKESI